MLQHNLKEVLIVGAFPKKQVYGGIYSSCKLIIDSNQFSEFKIIPFDSSQISNPPPSFIIRFFLAGIRILKFLWILKIKKPKAALIFCSDGPSAIEKGFMTLLCKFFSIKALIFPRAGKLIEQTKKSKLFRNLIKFFFEKTDIFLAQGENWNKFAQNQLQISQTKIKIIHNWTATDDLLDIGANKSYSKISNITKFLFVGWMEKEKGIYEIIESIKFLNNKKLKFTFTFIGDGKGMTFLKKLVEDNYLNDKVIFKGWVPSEKVKNYYLNSDIFVLPSWSEGMPNSLIEALSCGIACIISNVGMITNYLDDGISALIVPPNDSLSLKVAMEKLMLDKKLKNFISKNGHLVANKYFSTKKELSSLEKTIKQLF